MTTPVQTFGSCVPAELLDRITEYVLAAAPRMRGGVDDTLIERDTVRDALSFHALQGTLRVEWEAGGAMLRAPVGLAIVWQDFAAELKRLTAAGKDAFRWQRTNPEGDCIYIGLVITTAPGVMWRLGKYFRQRFPQLPELAHQRGKLRAKQWLNRFSLKTKG